MSRPLVLVLAGGASNRFWPLEDKPFLPFAGTCLLERHLRALRDLGCKRFVVVVRPGAEGRASEIGAGLALAEVSIAVQEEAAGMADAVLRAAPAFGGPGAAGLYVTQAQDVVDARLHEGMLAAASSTPATFATIAAARVKSYFPGGYLSLEGDRITSVVEKPGEGHEPGDLVNIVAHLFSDWRPLVERLQAEATRGGGDDAYERALASLMKDRIFHARVYEGRWEALKYPWQVLNVMDALLEAWASGREALPEGYELREDGVIMGRDVRIFPGAHIVAPALIGHNAVIGHNALVRGSMVGAGSVVGFGSEVARSYLGEGVELHHNYAGDSVLAGRRIDGLRRHDRKLPPRWPHRALDVGRRAHRHSPREVRRRPRTRRQSRRQHQPHARREGRRGGDHRAQPANKQRRAGRRARPLRR